MSKKRNKDFEKIYECSFCSKNPSEVFRLVAGPGVFICDECIQLCNAILLEDEENSKNFLNSQNLPKPEQIKAVLDSYVIGQEKAKKAIAVAVYNHYKRIQYKEKIKSQPNSKKEKNILNSFKNHFLELDKSNILLIGPSGSGKTLIAQTLAKILQVPIAIVDATALTEAGYVGEDVENILLRLHQAANQDISKTEMGIIYIDEIDKVARKGDNPSITRDVSGEGVQQALLKIIEGTKASVPPSGGRKHPHQEYLTIDTKNILFICGGAFEGLEDTIQNRIEKVSMGFDSGILPKKNDKARYLSRVTSEDLMKYGLIPEFVGRLPIVRTLDSLDEKALYCILTEPRNAIIKQYQTSFEIEGVKLIFEEDAIREIAKLGIAKETGARSLRSILEETMIDLMYEVSSSSSIKEVTITKEVIQKKCNPLMIYKDKINSKNKKEKKDINIQNILVDHKEKIS